MVAGFLWNGMGVMGWFKGDGEPDCCLVRMRWRMSDVATHAERVRLLDPPRMFGGRAVWVSLMMGFALTVGCVFFRDVSQRVCYTGLGNGAAGALVLSPTGQLAIIDVYTDPDPDLGTVVCYYQYWNRWMPALGLMNTIVERNQRVLTIIDKETGEFGDLTDNDQLILRQEIASWYRAVGEPTLAQQVMQPDGTDYRFRLAGLIGDGFWILGLALLFGVVSFKVRRLRYCTNPLVRRRRAILLELCPKCGYDTRLLLELRCPECGEKWDAIMEDE